MQSVLALLALLIGSAMAVPMTILTPDDDSQQNRAISSTEYLRRIFENSVSFSNPRRPVSDQYKYIRSSLTTLGLDEAAEILYQVDLRKILQDKDLSSITLFMPSDKAVKKWREELPEILKPGRSDLELLVKAWIVDAVIPSSNIRNNDVQRSCNGVGLRFNKYDTPDQREPKIITVNGARISRPDNKVQFCDSIIHSVDKVIYPLPAGNVVETLVDIPAFSKVIELVKKAGLSDSLSNNDPITMFVPTNAAFESLPAGALDDLVKNNTKLANLLKYHLYSENVKYSASMVQAEQSIVTAQGSALMITPDNDRIVLNKQKGESKMATVIQADVPTTNGVLHIIDRVLIPQESHYVLV